MTKNTTRSGRFVTKSREPGAKPCDWPGCKGQGEYRAPKSRECLNEYHWFCLDHVRAYNKEWNYYAGMTELEIEADRRRDNTWRRGTWKFGSNAERTIKDGFDDAFGLFDDDRDGPASDARTGGTVYGAEAAAYRLFKLDTTATLADIKARFKELSKLHHPDANDGDKGAEERFKKINEAYNTLVATF